MPSITAEPRMPVTFTTNAYADITMFGDIAVTLLKLMGHSGTVPGAIPEEDVPAALNGLRAAIGASQQQRPRPQCRPRSSQP